MFQVTRVSDKRIEIDFSGKLNSEEMRAAIDELLRKAEGIEHGRMLYRIGEFEFPTLGAVAVELARIPALFGMIRRFDRAAVVADKEWVRKASEIEGALIPGLEIKAFAPGEAPEAEVWLER